MMFKIISLRYKFSKKSDETGHSLFGFFYYKFLIYKIKKNYDLFTTIFSLHSK